MEGQMSPSATDLIHRLLDPDPESRLGSGGPEEVQTHLFFANIKWASIREDEPPFVPQTENVLDTQYFNQCKLNFPTDKYIGDEPITLEESKEYYGKESNILEDFDATMYPTLAGLNKQAAIEAQQQFDKQTILTPCMKRDNFFEKEYSINKLDMLKKVIRHDSLIKEKKEGENEFVHSFFRKLHRFSLFPSEHSHITSLSNGSSQENN